MLRKQTQSLEEKAFDKRGAVLVNSLPCFTITAVNTGTFQKLLKTFISELPKILCVIQFMKCLELP